MDTKISPDSIVVFPYMIAKEAIFILAISSIAIVLFLCYVVYLVVSDVSKPVAPNRRLAVARAVWSGLFITPLFISLIFAYYQTHPHSWLARSLLNANVSESSAAIMPGAVLLFAGIGASASLYFAWVRELWDDDRIRYTLLLWAGLWLLTDFTIVLLSHAAPFLSFKVTQIDSHAFFAQYITTIAQVSGIVIAATILVYTNTRNAHHAYRTNRRQIYQALELESVRLFQFECNHGPLIELLWFADKNALDAIEAFAKAPPFPDNHETPSLVTLFQLKEYTCQILNLFEMATSFCREDVLDADVFGSWLIWIWEVCSLPAFQAQWKGIESNYIAELREIINAGIHFTTPRKTESGSETGLDDAEDTGKAQRMRLFYEHVAQLIFQLDGVVSQALVSRWLAEPKSRFTY